MKFKNCLLLISLSISCNNVIAAEYDAVIDRPKGVELSLPVSGVIKTLNVVAGQFIEQGEVMLVLDQTPFKAAKVYAESRITVQQTLLKESTRDFNNRQELYDRTVLAAVQLENAELRVKRDTAYLNKARAQLDVADYELSYSKLTAPFSSLILSVHVNQGQSINNSIASKTLITLVRRGHYLARFSVSADAYEKLQIDQSITIKTQGENYQGKISAISFEHVKAGADQDVMYMIEAGFTADKKLLPVGDKVVVAIN